jgi:hypothetical protein
MTKAYPKVEYLKGEGLGSFLTHKRYTIPERLAGSKYSNLLQKFVTNSRKKFYNIASRYQTFLLRRWLFVVIIIAVSK